MNEPTAKAREERIKLRATYLNGLAISLFALGVLGPGVGTLIGTLPLSTAGVLLIAVASLAGSVTLHYFAWRIVGRLE
ncbi:MAG: hypothetical protein AAFR44_00240 [Pseudomonadota bacterium]